MTRRTEEQIRAYIDGYNDCFQQFCECLRNRKSVPDSIRKMRLFVDAVNKVTNRGEKDDQISD